MIKPAGLLACALSLGVLCSAAAHAATQVYKWIDSDGTVHYSAEPPPADAKTKMVMTIHSGIASDASPAPVASSAASTDAGSKKADAKGKDDPNAEIAEQNKAMCPQWKQDMQAITSIGRVRVPDDSGNLHYMTEDEKSGRLAQDQAEISQYCSD